MKIGFDLAQAFSEPTGCGWYARTLFDALTEFAAADTFIPYWSFAAWQNPGDPRSPLSPRANVVGTTEARQLSAEWTTALAAGVAPGAPDLVHSTSFQAPRLRSGRLVVTIYDLTFWTLPQFTTERIRLDCQRGVLDALAHADGLLFISEHARTEFFRLVPGFARRSTLPTEVTPLASRWQPTDTPAGEGDYWLAVGSLEPRKNLRQLLRAYSDYAAQVATPLPLWVAGGAGWNHAPIDADLAQLEARGQVRRLGYVPDAELPALYRGARGLVFPSWHEGFGLPVVEAMAWGCPVICSHTSSLPEVAGDAALLIDPARADQIEAALTRLHRDPTLGRELAARGLAQARRFSWEQTAKQTLAFYRAVVSA